MRLDDQPRCARASCPIWKHCGNKVSIFLTDIRPSRIQVFVSRRDNRNSYKATWSKASICTEHYRVLMEDYEQLGRDEVSEYNAMTAYYDRGGR